MALRIDRPTAADELQRVRDGVRRYAKEYGQDVFDCINAILTVKRTAADLQNFADNACKQVDLSSGRLSVLMALNAAPDKTMALSDIGDYLVVTRPNITGLVDGLVRDGLVRRSDHPEDRRMILAQLTERGRDFMRWFVPQHFKNVKAVMSCMSIKEQRQLVVLLDKLRSHLQRVDQPTIRSRKH